MDNHFNQGYMPSYSQAGGQQQSLASFGNLTNPSHQQDSPSHTTLPPLQSGYQFNNLPYGHPGSGAPTPTTPHTPSSSSMHSNSHSAFSHLTPPNNQPGSMLPPSSYSAPYNMTQSLPYPSATSTSLPPATSASGLPSLRPMPPTGLPSLSSTGQIGGPQPAFLQNEEQPTHVVGSQGRRGILPSAPGRPNPPAQGSAASAKSMIPQKDADGKYPCSHCNKTYLHAKHLKRHLLRHTGDRPYMCHLCKDTFSRSDILKRHFQKCSIRRGNPTGANHLAHQRRNTNNGNRLSISQTDGPIGLAGLPDVAGGNYSPTVNGDMSSRTSRANSMITPNTMSHRNSIAGLGILGSNVNSGEQMASSAAMQPGMPAYASSTAGGVQSNYAPQMNGSVFNGQQQQMSFLGQQNSRFDNNHNQTSHQQMPNGDSNGSNIDWNRMFNQGGQDGFIGTQPAKASSPAVKVGNSEREFNDTSTSNESFLGNLYTHPGVFGNENDGSEQGVWGILDGELDAPLQATVERLKDYCFPHGMDEAERDTGAGVVKKFLTTGGVKHLAEKYEFYHQHWPILHIPTFKLTEANEPLVLAILSVGAIYSAKVDGHQTRQMLEFVESTITQAMGYCDIDIPELQALMIMKSAFAWHGDSTQRQRAREELGDLMDILKGYGLFEPAPKGHSAYSALHASPDGRNLTAEEIDWDWRHWLEQEKRNRVVYQLLLMDASLAIFFNCRPVLNSSEISLTLPADDAAWNAKDSQTCAGALGLHGLQAQMNNRTGTKQLQQPGLQEAMCALLNPQFAFLPNTTNVYSKFILIHAIIVRIVACQQGSTSHSGEADYGRQSPVTPVQQPDLLTLRFHNASSSVPRSELETPTEVLSQGVQNAASQQERKALGQALDKWKRSWDTDMSLQYPLSQTGPQRIGFCRHGAHFFYLGRSFIQSQNAGDWSAPADARFVQVMALLKRIRGFAVGRLESRGQETASFGHVDAQHAQNDLSLDMSLLFQPYNGKVDNADALVPQPQSYPF